MSAMALSQYTTFQLGGPCRSLFDCATPAELAAAVVGLAEQGESFVLMGGGSNVLVSDEGTPAAVVRYQSDTLLVERRDDLVVVSGSTGLDELVRFAIGEGMAGLEFLSGIPGTVGGAIAGNAGAWGRQIGEVLESATLLNRRGDRREAAPSELGFAYRSSCLQVSGDIVLSAAFRLSSGRSESLAQERTDILRKRAERHPDLDETPCAGSFFRNIEPTSKAERRQAAGWFLEQAGAKDMVVGGARVFDRHANIIVKGPGCTAQDVRDLAVQMASAVWDRFGLRLQREARFLGSFRGEEGAPPDKFY